MICSHMMRGAMVAVPVLALMLSAHVARADAMEAMTSLVAGARDPVFENAASVDEYAYLSRGPYDTGQYVKDMRYGNVRYQMRVFYPIIPDDEEGCKPVVANIHPAQAIDATPETQYWDVCLSVASYGMHCVLSMETNCCAGRRTKWASDLANRHLDMFRQLKDDSANDRDSPVYGRVCNKVCSVGYSLGGGSASLFALQAQASDGVMCVAPLHSAYIGDNEASRLRVPVYYGNSNQDTLLPARRGIREFSENAQVPLFVHVLDGGRHLTDGIIGRHQPAFLKFMKLIMENDQRWASMLWDSDNDQIEDQRDIDYVQRYPRASVSALSSSITLPVNSVMNEIEVVRGENTGIASDFILRVGDVSGSCMIESTGESVAVQRRSSATFSLMANARAETSCTAVVWLENVGASGGFSRSASVRVDISATGAPLCTVSEWSAWSDSCPCCDDDSSVSTVSAVSRSRAVGRAAPVGTSRAVSRGTAMSMDGGADAMVLDEGECSRTRSLEIFDPSSTSEEDCLEYLAENESDTVLSESVSCLGQCAAPPGPSPGLPGGFVLSKKGKKFSCDQTCAEMGKSCVPERMTALRNRATLQAALTEAGGPICDSFIRGRNLNRKQGVPGYRVPKNGRVKCVASGESLGIATTCAKEIGIFSLCYCEE